MNSTGLGASRFTRPVARFLALESASGLLLLAATVVALIWANSPWKDAYSTLLSHHVSLSAGPIDLHIDVQEFVNDALMAVFFFVVGLEIKRELVKGELRDRRTAALPVIAAVGGMIVPALIYVAINAGTSTIHGWGIPMATDIAFAVGVVALLGNRVPVALKLFLLSLAVVDDLGAIAVIAIFYTSSIAFGWLLGAVGMFALIAGLRLVRVPSMIPYLLLGVVAWYCMFKSGVHATVAGVALGFLTPLAPMRGQDGRPAMAERLENALHPWSAYVIVPVFALCNAGVVLTIDALSTAASSTVTWGVALGLVVGKTIGVAATSLLAIRLGLVNRPRGVSNVHMLGIAMAAGIGFTVALFVTNLAFTDAASADQSRIGILGASLVAALGAAAVLRLAASRSSSTELAFEAAENAELFD
jgi:NhaA family Na+:H+ antiporter